MQSPRTGLITALAMSALVVLPVTDTRLPRTVAPRPTNDPHAKYTVNDKEFYLSEEQIGYIRPGFHITVNSVTIPDDLRPVSDLSFTDDAGQPLDRNGAVTPGSLSINQVLAWYDPATRDYTSYTTRTQTGGNGVTAIQAAADSGGTWTDVTVGHSIYKFKTALPADFDRTKTTTLAIYATRNLSDIIGKNDYANVEYDFRPDGGAIAATDVWDKTNNAACNTCHTHLSAHGGSRQDVKLCATCHQPQTTDPDTGNTLDMKVMVHKIHMGSSLPSVEAGTPYVIIGNNGSVNDFSDVVFPQDIRNCQSCHTSTATQGANWYIYPSQAACASCHDSTTFTAGGTHTGGPQADDSQCSTCHQPQGSREYDASIMGAHTVPAKSTQLKGLNAAIVGVTNAAPGQHPTILFQITENDGTPVAPSSLGTNLDVLMDGPTTDYPIQPFKEDAPTATVGAGGVASYTFTNAIPSDATGTWVFSIEAKRDVAVTYPPPGTTTIREAAFNPIFYANLSGGTPEPRRTVVDVASCNSCHDRLAFHGGGRLNPQECVICHNPNFTNSDTPPEGIDFKRLVHRLHTGTELTQPYLDFNTLRFPGDRRVCTICHVDGTQQVQETMPAGRLPTQAPRDYYSPQQPTAAACLGCHDSQAAAAHAFVMTAPFGEACAVCHGPDADFSVDKVHAQ